jgi:hypothetical protein
LRFNKPANAWRYFPGILISILAVFFLSRFVNLQDLITSFRIFSFTDVLILTLILICSLVARGMAWKSFLTGMSFKDGFLIINEGYLLNNLIPRSGEIARIFITSSMTKNDSFQVAAAIFFERAVDLLIAAGMFLSTLSLVFEMQWLKKTAVLIMVVFSLLLIIILAIAYFSPAIESFIGDKRFRNVFMETRAKPIILRAIRGLTTISQPQKLLPAFVWIIVTWCFWVLMLYYAILRLSPAAPLWWALFTEGMIALGIALPAAPANLGVYEGTIVFALSVFGISSDKALGAAILLHIIQIAITIVFGLAGLFIHDFRISHIIEKIRSQLFKEKNNHQDI